MLDACSDISIADVAVFVDVHQPGYFSQLFYTTSLLYLVFQEPAECFNVEPIGSGCSDSLQERIWGQFVSFHEEIEFLYYGFERVVVLVAQIDYLVHHFQVGDPLVDSFIRKLIDEFLEDIIVVFITCEISQNRQERRGLDLAIVELVRGLTLFEELYLFISLEYVCVQVFQHLEFVVYRLVSRTRKIEDHVLNLDLSVFVSEPLEKVREHEVTQGRF